MAGALPPLGGLTVNAPPGGQPPPLPVFPMRDLPPELIDEVLASYLAKLDVGELCEANLLQICMLLRGTNQCNDPDDPLWKAACARFGLPERLVGGVPGAPATPTWHVTFLAMCKEVATLKPDGRAVYEGLLRGDDAYTDTDSPFSDSDDSEDDDADEEATPQRRLRLSVSRLWFHAVENGLFCMMHSLLRRVDGIVDTDANYRYEGQTALARASMRGHADVVEVLLAHGANVHAVDDDALRTASIYGHLAVVEVLLAAGANVHGRDDEALWDASASGHVAVVEVLLAHGADVHAANDAALADASVYGHLAVVEVLLAAGANVHARDDAALRAASLSGHTAVVEVLLAHGADVHAVDGAALRFASQFGHAAVVEALRAAGATE